MAGVRRQTLEARRTAILQTTCNVLVERGFNAMRIADVARQLGVSTGLIHYHFESKDQLLAEALRFAADEEMGQLEDEIAKASGPIAKLDTFFASYCPKDAEPGWLLWIDAWGESLRSPELRRISQELDLASVAIIQSVIEVGVADGTFTSTDTYAAAWRLAALVDGLAVQLTVHDGVVDGITMMDWVRQGAANELGFDVTRFTRRRAANVA